MISTFGRNGEGNFVRVDYPDEYVPVRTPGGVDKLNRWHTRGLGNESQLDPLCQLAMEKLPRMVLPVHIGNTGYIHLNSETKEFPNSWCVDDMNRVVFIFNNVLYFQRYETSGPIMHNPLSKRCFNEVLRTQQQAELLSQLENL